MLDDFISDQAIAYKIFKNSISKNKLSHAYLINTNGYHKGFDFAKAFAKYLLCPSDETGSHECSVCHLIDNNSYSEFKVIEADGLWIKKEQTDELQEMFSMKSLSGRKVYIINGVENLNISASNSILKFLEEPEEGIVAILITDNIYRYASNEEYYDCASVAFSQMSTLLSGGKILEPMRHISNGFVAIVVSFFTTFLIVLGSSGIKKAKYNEIINNSEVSFSATNVTGVKTGTHRVYSPVSESSGGGSSGGGGGGGGGGSSGGGGGHSF